LATDAAQTHEAIVAYLESALKFAEEIEDGAAAYLIEQALDEARSGTFSSVRTDVPMH
jgi:hypothetical protein